MSADAARALPVESPFRIPIFRAMWTAALVSNIGTWMQNVAAAWLMTQLSASALVVALVQTATSLPFFFLALPAGALADLADRRRLLIITQFMMLVPAGALGVLTLMGRISPSTLLWLTFLLGAGTALNAPAWQAITSELVPPEQLAKAMAANSATINVARAVGPALGGLVVARMGAGPAFLLNAASFLAVLFVLASWKRPPDESLLPAERILGAMRTGLRYVRNEPPVLAILWHATVFVIFGSSIWALLPVIASESTQKSSLGFGILLAILGTGAVIGTFLLGPIRGRFHSDHQVIAGALLYGVGMLVPAVTPRFAFIAPAMFVAGVGWMLTLVPLNTAVQQAAPAWVRARVLAVYMLLFQGGLALGSVLWGALASSLGTRPAMGVAFAGLLGGILTMRRRSLALAEGYDVTPGGHWPDPVIVWQPAPDDGPVLVTVEYVVDPQQSERFTNLMHAIRRLRLRDGAFQWGIFQDTAQPGRFLETFLVESWVEHLRQHQRATATDRILQDLARTFLVGMTQPRVTHLIHSRNKPQSN